VKKTKKVSRIKPKTPDTPKIYVAVVHKAWNLSGRPDGDWASFLDKNKNNAVDKAVKAKRKWEAAGNGPYKIWVGELTQAVSFPQEYVLGDIEERPDLTSYYSGAVRGVFDNRCVWEWK
jgi:hypothetical protein